MKQFTILCMILVISSGFLQTVCAQPQEKPRAPVFIEDLNLSKEQKDRIHELRENFKKSVEKLKADIAGAQEEKEALVKKGTIDRKAFLDIQNKITVLKTQLRAAIDNHKMDVYEMLTPEQQKQIEKSRFFFEEQRQENKGPDEHHPKHREMKKEQSQHPKD